MNIEKAIRENFGQQKFMTLIGAELKVTEPGFCEIHLPFKPELTQQNGYFHAGVIGTIADTAGGYAAYSMMQPGDSVLTVEYKLNLLSPAEGSHLIVRCKVIKAGRTLTVCSADVFAVKSDAEQLCATAVITLIALKNYKNI